MVGPVGYFIFPIKRKAWFDMYFWWYYIKEDGTGCLKADMAWTA
jgi:hypothetical protein